MAMPPQFQKSKASKGKMPNDGNPFGKAKDPKAKVTKPGAPKNAAAPGVNGPPPKGSPPSGPIPPSALGSMVQSLKGVGK
jgi:hypothetical protein